MEWTLFGAHAFCNGRFVECTLFVEDALWSGLFVDGLFVVLINDNGLSNRQQTLNPDPIELLYL